MGKPTSYVDWANGSASYRTEPSSGKKGTGFVYQEYPPGDELNWLFYNVGLWTRWLGNSVFKDFATVGSGTYDDYADINAAVAGGASKIILTSDIEVTTQQTFSINDGIIIGNGYSILQTTGAAIHMLYVSGYNCRINDLTFYLTNTTGTVTSALTIVNYATQARGIRIQQNGAGGTLTNGLYVNANYNIFDGIIRNQAGTMTYHYRDLGTDNDLRIVEI